MKKSLKSQFIKKCHKTGVSVEEFSKDVISSGSENALIAVIMINERLDLYQTAIEKIRKVKPEYEDPRLTLEKFCEANTVAASPFASIMKINGAGHGRALRSFWRLLIGNRGKTKKHVTWLNGKANGGKSSFMRRVFKIFSTHMVGWRGVYLPLQD